LEIITGGTLFVFFCVLDFSTDLCPIAADDVVISIGGPNKSGEAVMNLVKRRQFIGMLGGAAAIWPLKVRAQQPAMPVVGFLNGTLPDPLLQRAASFRQGLTETGFVDRKNVAIVFRWAEFQDYQLPKLAADLVGQQVAVIAATGSTAAALAAKRATSTIPIVFEMGGDPITAGLVDNLERPGGNLTGVSLNVGALGRDQLALVRDLIPKAATVAVFVNPGNPNSGTQARIEAAARAIGMRTLVLNVSQESGFDQPFAALMQQHADALIVGNDPFFLEWRAKIIALAERYAVPTIYSSRAYVAAGGLVSYGVSITEGYAQVGVYVGRILKGEKPADLPVVNTIKFKLAINMTTARVLGLDVPQAVMARADEVIQ
jgi:putative tryptophan/tyrosine transport system substrate-binding protein